MEIDEGLSVKVETEFGERYARPSEAQLRDLVGRLGEPGDNWLVMQRIPDVPDVFAQLWHERGGDYQLEHRESRERFLGTIIPDAETVADALVGWARQRGGWDGRFGWTPVAADPPEQVPELPRAIREEVEERVRELLRCGYDTRATLAEAAEEYLVEGRKRPVSAAQARELVDRLWLERLAEQATWQGTTDPERLTRAFEALTARGVTAREDFACCRNCGTAEIGAERAEGDHGFVYFHSQCTEGAAAGHGLMLLYGGFDGSAETTAAVGREVVDALTAAGLSTEWDGDPSRAITVTPLTWEKRLEG
ncbi:hypothetical protein EJ357_12980 [Streptomyces cyaneochromogenes]|uniref:DUF6891 domain-containing protein n=1 Tax=Streptomyces cyaneochromogenes TaxID=2496836 RepID=A0A3Q9ERH5_9ACTN|nr:hypothetical protein [Streptomyces cyaneochromogenes]AZQ34283.1 hypothetical protein EJ357_12980 [Streptomyces cyaneochromogenes]